MTIAITGATGFVGQSVVEVAQGKGTPIRALTRRKQEPREGVEWVRGSLADTAALAELCAGAHCVIHIAGLTNTPNPSEFAHANVSGTRRLLTAAKSAGVGRFVFVSSLSAREPKLSAYGASKAQAEELVQASAFDWTIVRPPAVYGPRDNDMLDLFKAAKLGIVPVPPTGRASIIHVRDLADLLLALVPADKRTQHAIYEPADDNPAGLEHAELAGAIGRAVGRERVFAPHLPKPLLLAGAAADKLLRGDKAKLTADRVGYMTHPDWVARLDRLVPDDIWHPRIGAAEGMAETARWYREAGWL